MQRIRPLYRIAKLSAPRAAPRSYHSMSLFPRFSHEVAPLFRLLDDYATTQLARSLPTTTSSLSSPFGRLAAFNPRFDLREVNNSYELHGELPGIAQKDLSIEWVDEKTLSISGRTEQHVEQTNANMTDAEAAQDSSSAAASETSSKQPTVEDDNAGEGSSSAVAKTATEIDQTVAQRPPEGKYWISERSVGKFQRSFSFPSRVNHDEVKASLKNGILSIVVPKAAAPQPKKINIE